jgi:hypothetical protein
MKKNHFMKSSVNQFIALLTLVFSVIFGNGCSSDDEPKPNIPNDTIFANNDYGIQAYVAKGDKVEALIFKAEAHASSDVDVVRAPLSPKDVTFGTDAGATISIGTSSTSTMSDLARMALSECGLRGGHGLNNNPASGSCVYKQPASAKPYVRGSAYIGTASGSPVQSVQAGPAYLAGIDVSCPTAATLQPFLFFYNEPTTAAHVLQYEETLVCAASKLAELAENDKPTVWPFALDGLRTTFGSTTVVDLPDAPFDDVLSKGVFPPVTFRVVQPKDRFLVRDLAIELLSYVPLVDQFPLQVGAAATARQTASQIFSSVAVAVPPGDLAMAAYNAGAAGSTPAATTVAAVGSAGLYYPPISLTAGAFDWPLTARKHLEMETANLRVAGQLMQDLINKNVYGALGGAMQKAASLPPAERVKALWSDGADGNSITQISRVLFGRQGTLGMLTTASGVQVSPTNCNLAGTGLLPPGDVWKLRGSTVFAARPTDVPLKSSYGLRAEKLLSLSRLVLGSTAVPVAAVRTEVYNQLRNQMMATAGQNQTVFESTLVGQQLQQRVASVSDENMRIAMTRQNALVSSNLNEVLNGTTTFGRLAGANFAPAAVPGIGYLINAPMQRDPYDGDVMAPLGSVQAASECSGTNGGPADETTFLTADRVILGDPLSIVALPANVGKTSGAFTPRNRSYQFQDAFAVGQAIRDRLVRLRQYASFGANANNLGVNSATAEDVKARAAAVFEIDAWAGGTRVVLIPGATAFTLTILDAKPSDFGLSDTATTTEIQNAFAIVAPVSAGTDQATLAQCAAGTRKTGCPTPNNGLWKATSALAYNAAAVTVGVPFPGGAPSPATAQNGLLRTNYQLTFPIPAAGVQPLLISGAGGAANIAKLLLTVVRVPTPLGPGQVLGSRQAIGSWTGNVANFTTAFAVSPLRRKLVEAVFGFPKANDDPNATLADTRDYCIPGVPRDVFVPLENELTSDNDTYESSWKHYLTLAKAAAQKADELGREVVDIGTRIEERKEGAFDQLTLLNGANIDPNCLGEDPVTKDRNVATCGDSVTAALSADRLDLVLLSEAPASALSKPPNGAAAAAELATLLKCSTAPTKPRACDILTIPGAQAVLVDTAIAKSWKRPAAPANTVYFAALKLVTRPNPQPAVPDATVCSSSTSTPYSQDGLEAYLQTTRPKTAAELIANPSTDSVPNWAASDSLVREALKGAKFIVQDTGDFSVTSNGATLVDSSAQNQTWPGCLRVTPSTCFNTATNRVSASINTALNTLFRSCSGNITGILGTCDALSAQPTAAWEEIAGIRWRMMGALWLAQSLSGGAPAGAFNVPIPAVWFPGTFAPGPVGGETVCALPITVYGPARFSLSNITEYRLTGTQGNMTANDGIAFNYAVQIPPTFSAMPATAASQMPVWYRSLYSAATPASCFRTGTPGNGGVLYYLHARGLTAQVVSNTDPLVSWFNAVGGAAGVAGGRPGVRLDGWRTLATATAQNHPDYTKMIAAIKTWFEPNSPGMALYHDHFAPDYFMIGAQYRGYEYFGPGLPLGVAGIGQEFPTAYRWSFLGVQEASLMYDRDCSIGVTFDFGQCAFGGPSENRPSIQSASLRARFFVNSMAPLGQVEAVRQFQEAAALTCIVATVPAKVNDGDPPPVLTSPNDVKQIEAWIAGREILALNAINGMYLENVPMLMVDAFNTDASGAGRLKGQMGAVAIEATTAMRSIARSYSGAVNTLDLMRLESRSLAATLTGYDATSGLNDANATLRTLERIQQVATAAASALSLNPLDILKGVGNLQVAALGSAAAQAIDDMEVKVNEIKLLNAQRQQALIGASRQMTQYRKEQNDLLADVKDKVGVLQVKLLAFEDMKRVFANLIEKASGSGVWVCKDATNTDITCRSYVNTVLNKRYSGTVLRYEMALTAARTAGYYARRAIEQRIGVRLDTLEGPIGPLEAPSKWADRVCTMHGVDFDTLKKEEVITDPALRKAWQDLKGREYANSFIGDYVDLLSNFMEFYNVAYPSKDGDDTLLLSMREDIERQGSSCLDYSKNRLVNTEWVAQNTEDKVATDRAWQLHKCTSATKCLQAQTWNRNPTFDVADPPLPDALQRGTWLRTRAPSSQKPEQGIPGKTGYLSQSVVLPSGAYVLSFRDGALDPVQGVPSIGQRFAYAVAVFDDSDQLVARAVFTPAAVVLTTGGNVRVQPTPRTLRFTAPSTSRFRIAFAAAANDGQDGSVLIAEPQLERDTGTAPTGYEATDNDGYTRKDNCASSPQQLRARFVRSCDAAASVAAPARCYYDSLTSFPIDTQTLSVNGQSLAEKLAAENFNYRHIDFALNLVGTGVKNCDENPTPGCYSSGTIEYDLIHEGNQIGILGYDKESRRFDFGEGAIRHGKALSIERYLTLPLSSADNGLLSQTGMTKPELRGRPLDGRYRLRIYENPALRWNNLEDVQLMFRYRYWSRVVGSTP